MLSMPLLGQFKEISHFSISKKKSKIDKRNSSPGLLQPRIVFRLAQALRVRLSLGRVTEPPRPAPDFANKGPPHSPAAPRPAFCSSHSPRAPRGPLHPHRFTSSL